MVLHKQPVKDQTVASGVIIVRASLILSFLLLLYSMTTVQDLQRSLIICTKQEGQCYFLEITDISWYFSLQQEEYICTMQSQCFMFSPLTLCPVLLPGSWPLLSISSGPVSAPTTGQAGAGLARERGHRGEGGAGQRGLHRVLLTQAPCHQCNAI